MLFAKQYCNNAFTCEPDIPSPKYEVILELNAEISCSERSAFSFANELYCLKIYIPNDIIIIAIKIEPAIISAFDAFSIV